jgi:hypothetical protein
MKMDIWQRKGMSLLLSQADFVDPWGDSTTFKGIPADGSSELSLRSFGAFSLGTAG